MEIVQLEKAPKIAVYTPNGKQPWDDAVTLVLSYAEIPYEEIYDDEIVKWNFLNMIGFICITKILQDSMVNFMRTSDHTLGTEKQVSSLEASAKSLGFQKVSEMKLAVAMNIKNFVIGGGFLFTMCSGTDSFDIALAAQETDICESMFDGDPFRKRLPR